MKTGSKMILHILCSTVLLVLVHASYAHEYLYPVASIKKGDQSYLYMLYQKSYDQLELLLWDPETKIICKALKSSSCMPVGISILPEGKGFSFLDNGRIKVKLFNKHSPKSIDLYECIYDFESITWVDAQNFYFSAKEHGLSAIFQGSMQLAAQCLCRQAGKDCMYPQKVGAQLFYIQRTTDELLLYSIMQVPYCPLDDQQSNFNSLDSSECPESFDARVEIFLKQKELGLAYKHTDHPPSNRCIMDCGEQPIAFLHMETEDYGFFIQHAQKIDPQDTIITLAYYQVKKYENGAWQSTQLFSFDIPLSLISQEAGGGYTYRSENPDALHEKMLPLLPRHAGGDIFYMSAAPDDCNNLDIFKYNVHQKKSVNMTQSVDGQYHFAPIAISDKVFYGGSLRYENESRDTIPATHDRFVYKKKETNNQLPIGMWINRSGNLCYDVSCFDNENR